MTGIADWPKSFFFGLHQAHFLIEKRLAEKLSEAGLVSFSQFLVLMSLCCRDKASQCSIAENLFITEATVSRHVRALLRCGLVTKRTNPKSHREFLLALTPKGRREMERSRKAIDDEIDRIISEINERDRQQMMTTMQSLLSALYSK